MFEFWHVFIFALFSNVIGHKIIQMPFILLIFLSTHSWSNFNEYKNAFWGYEKYQPTPLSSGPFIGLALLFSIKRESKTNLSPNQYVSKTFERFTFNLVIERNSYSSCMRSSRAGHSHFSWADLVLQAFDQNCINFCQSLTNALLESAEWGEWPKKLFHGQSPRKLRGSALIRTCDRWTCSQTWYELRYGARLITECWWNTSRSSNPAQQTHDVYTTSSQRRCNVMTLHRRWGDVV